jgi:concentrative nucleoside transporter, CNT family
VLGLLVFQTAFFLSSKNRKAIPWPTVIVGLFIQQAIAMFVLKTGAGYSIFTWIATLAADFLNQAQTGVSFFFNQDIADSHWFFASTVQLFTLCVVIVLISTSSSVPSCSSLHLCK